MAIYTAKKKTSGMYEVFKDGQRISTGSASGLASYGLSPTKLSSGATPTKPTPTAPTPPPKPTYTPPTAPQFSADKYEFARQMAAMQPIPPKTTTPAPTPAQPTSTYQGTSIVDYLKSTGQASDYATRAKLAQEKGITGYRGTAQQNTQLLGILRGGEPTLPTPTPTPTITKTPTSLTQDQISEYYRTEGTKASPLSPMDWLAKQTTAPTTPTTAKDTTEQTEEQQRQAELNQINETERAEAEKELGIIEQEATGEVDVSKSAKLIASLYEAEIEQPEAPSLIEQFQTERQRLGIEPLETELAGIDSQIEEIQSNLIIEAEKAGERLVPMGQITRRRGKLQTEADQRIQRLQIERNSVARRLDNKMNTLKIVMDLTQQDFANASASYDKEFSKNIQLINLLAKEEDADKAEAQANLNTIVNLAQESGKTFSELTPDIQRQISTLEVQMGLTAGTMESFLSSKPKSKVLSTTTGVDAAGNKITTFIYEDPETGMPGVVEVIGTGGVDVKTTEDDDRKQEFDDAVAWVKENKDKTRAELKLVLQRDSDLNNSEINNILDAEGIKDKKPTKPLKEQIVGFITKAKETGFSRSQAKSTIIQKIKDKLGDIPDMANDIIEDTLVSVYGRTLGQKIIPGGR